MITALAFHFSDGIYGWMLILTAIQDLALASLIVSKSKRKGE